MISSTINCEEFGYTLYTCNECGYSYKGNYTFKNHTVDTWNTVLEPTYEEEGREEGICSACQTKVYRNVPVKEEEIVEKPEIEVKESVVEAPLPKEEKKETQDIPLTIFMIAAMVIGLGLIVGIAVVLLRGKRR